MTPKFSVNSGICAPDPSNSSHPHVIEENVLLLTKKGNVVNECLCGLYLHYVSRQDICSLEVVELRYKNFS